VTRVRERLLLAWEADFRLRFLIAITG
jgi:hypothetical protein